MRRRKNLSFIYHSLTNVSSPMKATRASTEMLDLARARTSAQKRIFGFLRHGIVAGTPRIHLTCSVIKCYMRDYIRYFLSSLSKSITGPYLLFHKVAEYVFSFRSQEDFHVMWTMVGGWILSFTIPILCLSFCDRFRKRLINLSVRESSPFHPI